ncbi:DUF4305 domain-containing protein [Lentibacillus sp. JNUCC-1]|uniref:DUF4305 domain-containing protein n=1 Tax=Lentibacillus sp. JNUCC-1 TaxID=2654513 RepID=UPI0018D21455|nr:DUF4305 domain-containing protein [Lentibacillus sp. JNUCC-1]
MSALTNAIIYFILGGVFFWLALGVPGDRFNLMSIALVVVAAIDIGLGIRFLRAHFHNKNKNKK